MEVLAASFRFLSAAVMVLLVFGMAAGDVNAQATGSLTGVVRRSPTGEGLPGVEVVLEEKGRTATTGLRGRFDIPRLEAGPYTVVFSSLGFRTVRQTVTVASGERSELEVVLEPAPVQLDEVLARADRSFSAASSRVARDFDLLIRPVRTAQELLQLAPGLVTAQHAGGGKAEQIFLRGFDADHGTDVAITVDGVPVNMVSHGHGQGYADVHFVIPEVVDRIDVQKGPYRAETGNFATAGAVSFVTRDHLTENLVRVNGGAFGTAGVTALYQIPTAGPHQGAYLAGQYSETDGPFDAPQDFTRFNLFGKFHTHLGEGARLAVTGSGFSSAWNASGQIPERVIRAGMIGRFGAIDDLEGGTTGRHDLNLQFETGSTVHELQLQGYYSRYNFKLFSNFTFFLEDPVRGDMIEQTDQRQLHGLNGSYRFAHALGPFSAATWLGGGFRADDVEVGLWHSPGRVRDDLLVDAGITERNLYLWALGELLLTPRLRVQLGVRGDYFTYDVDDRLEGRPSALPRASGYAQQAILSPKLNVVLSPAAGWDLFANFGTGFHSNDARNVVIDGRVANLVQTYARAGLDDAAIDDSLRARSLDPAHRAVETLPRAPGAELGMRARPVNALNVAAAAWILDLDREFVYVGDGGFTELSGRTRRYGLDLETRLALTPWLSIDSDLSLSRGRFRDEEPGSNRIPLAPSLTWTGGVTALRDGGVDAALRFVHIEDRPANEDGSVVARGYTVFNLSGGWRLGRVRLSAVVENLLDADWNEAQFDTMSRLRQESAPVSELHFTPGNPRNARVGVALYF